VPASVVAFSVRLRTPTAFLDVKDWNGDYRRFEEKMSEIQEIEVVVAPDGTVKLLVRGAHGKKCLALTEEVEALVGGAVVERVFTDEYDLEEIELEQDEVLKQRDV
jgi:hypothetical protein